MNLFNIKFLNKPTSGTLREMIEAYGIPVTLYSRELFWTSNTKAPVELLCTIEFHKLSAGTVLGTLTRKNVQGNECGYSVGYYLDDDHKNIYSLYEQKLAD